MHKELRIAQAMLGQPAQEPTNEPDLPGQSQAFDESRRKQAKRLRELDAQNTLMLKALKAVVKALDYRNASTDPTQPSYVNPAIMVADRAIAEKLAREAVVTVETKTASA